MVEKAKLRTVDSPEELEVKRFMRRFAGYDQAYGTYDPDAARPAPDKPKVDIKSTARLVKKPVTFELWRSHLQGISPLGIIPIRRDNTCVWGAIDIDDYDLDIVALMQTIAAAGFPLVTCATKSGGVHLFLFTGEPVPAAPLIRRLQDMAAYLGYGKSEIFPKQSKVNWDAGDYGSWLNMPYFGETRWSYL